MTLKKWHYFCAALSCCSVAAQAQQTLPDNALDHMLQRVRITKQYDNKHFGDHLFLEGGVGGNVIGSGNMKPGFQLEGAIGDRITPEHSLRLGAQVGMLRTASAQKLGFVGASLDYMMNITAIANRKYTTARAIDIYGVAGLDYLYSCHHGSMNDESGMGAHLGLRGQVKISPYTYFYLEPRVGLWKDDVTQMYQWRGMRPVASVSAGLGFNMNEDPSAADKAAPKRLYGKEGVFLSAMAGGGLLAWPDYNSWRDYPSASVMLSIGKWFTPAHGARVSFKSSVMKQPDLAHMKFLGFEADYLINLHQAFGGTNFNRRWWVNGVLGVSQQLGLDKPDNHHAFGVGAGLQGNVRMGGGYSLVIEPRVDCYTNKYVPTNASFKSYDIVPSLMAGLSYTYLSTWNKHAGQAPDAFVQRTWHDNMFVDMGAGVNLPIIRPASEAPKSFIEPQAHLGIGKWFTANHGARVWAQAARTKYASSSAYDHMAVGAEYLINFSNLAMGYHERRYTELVGSLGMNVATHSANQQAYFGLNAGLRATYYPSKLLGLYIEPRLYGYGKHFLPSQLKNSNVDLVTTLSAGAQINLKGYEPGAAREAMLADGGYRRSFSIAGGIATRGDQLRTKSYYGPSCRVSYTNYFGPAAAWRVNGEGFIRKAHGVGYGHGLLGADLLTDFTALTYGYDYDRPVSLLGFTGFGMGMLYTQGRSRFLGDLHFGGQAAVRVAPGTRLFLEPQVAYRMSKEITDGTRLKHWAPQLLLGVDYSMKSLGGINQIEAQERNRFVAADFGLGGFSGTVGYMKPNGRKLTFTSTLSAGYWFTGVHGADVTVSNTHIQRYGKGSENIISVNANYLMNLRAAVTGESTNDKLFQLNGLVGPGLYIGLRPNEKTTYVPGVQAALQFGFRVSPEVELYIQPKGTLYSKKIEAHPSAHPFEGEMSLSFGTKYNF